MQITKKWLRDKNACSDGVRWYLKNGKTDSGEIFDDLINENKLSDANWLVTNMFKNKKQIVSYSIFAAELCIDNFEKEFPDDNHPRKAIEAAKKYLKKQTRKNKEIAWSAAESAESAAESAWSAAESAAESAWSAAWSAESAESAALIKIINYGRTLL